ncbi:hypothetical protein ACO2I3_08520 [Leptospira interrogans]
MKTNIETVSEENTVRELTSEEVTEVTGGKVMEVRILGFIIQARAGAWAVWDKSNLDNGPVAWGEA